MNQQWDSEKGSVVDFAVHLIIMLIILTFASLWCLKLGLIM